MKFVQHCQVQFRNYSITFLIILLSSAILYKNTACETVKEEQLIKFFSFKISMVNKHKIDVIQTFSYLQKRYLTLSVLANSRN